MIVELPRPETKLADQLQSLLNVLPLSHPKRKLIETDLRKILSGGTGEKDVAYHLRFWYENDPDVVVMNDLRLEFNGRSAQIDHLVAVPAGFLVLESKSLPDKIRISSDGNWFRVKKTNNGEVKQGIYNPVEQNKRHIAVLKDIFGNLETKPELLFANVIVLTNPETVIEGHKPGDAYLIRLDKLNEFINQCKRSALKEGALSATSLIYRLEEYHRPITIDIYKRYGIDARETVPVKERIKFDVRKKMYTCAFCGSQMILRRNQNGLFWSCSSYPHCRNNVPAAIAVEVGNEACDLHERQKGFLEFLFTSKLKLCPICGAVLELKHGKKKDYWACPNAYLCKYRL